LTVDFSAVVSTVQSATVTATLSLHDALPIFVSDPQDHMDVCTLEPDTHGLPGTLIDLDETIVVMPDIRPLVQPIAQLLEALVDLDRKSTRLNSSHVSISYAVFCLKKKKRHTG